MRALLISFLFLGILTITIVSCQSEQELEFKRYYTSGAVLYQTYCQNCHAPNGGGLGALIPPLTDSAYLKRNKTALACFIKYGLKGPVTVKGKIYMEQMPQQANLAPIEIAQILTYITNSFNNKLGVTNVQQADADLKTCAD